MCVCVHFLASDCIRVFKEDNEEAEDETVVKSKSSWMHHFLFGCFNYTKIVVANNLIIIVNLNKRTHNTWYLEESFAC